MTAGFESVLVTTHPLLHSAAAGDAALLDVVVCQDFGDGSTSAVGHGDRSVRDARSSPAVSSIARRTFEVKRTESIELFVVPVARADSRDGIAEQLRAPLLRRAART
tara:strand:- start:25 stop:345 length:321 start_codon:yes stop_codon:yes gene_type:complete